MAYDNFANTPFDRNHDGHIDANEAAYIYDTFYNEDTDEAGYDDDITDGICSGGGWHLSDAERRKQNDEIRELRRSVQESDRTKKQVTIGIMFALGILVPSKGVALILIGIVYVIASMFDVFL